MKITTLQCDIKSEEHSGGVALYYKTPVLFDHDQEDGKSRVKPYFEMKDLDLCEKHFTEMTEKRKLIYVYGAMGHNTYSL